MEGVQADIGIHCIEKEVIEIPPVFDEPSQSSCCRPVSRDLLNNVLDRRQESGIRITFCCMFTPTTRMACPSTRAPAIHRFSRTRRGFPLWGDGKEFYLRRAPLSPLPQVVTETVVLAVIEPAHPAVTAPTISLGSGSQIL
jgi:hypothetical protein